MTSTTVIAAVVTFHPDNDALNRLIRATQRQVSRTVIIDNTPNHTWVLDQDIDFNALEIISLADNMGIGYAQNIAFEYCKKQKADFVLLLDQDSVPHPEMVAKLVHQFCHLESQGINVAITAPVNVDARTQLKSQFLVFQHGYPVRQKWSTVQPEAMVTEACFVIASGSLVSIRSICKIGGNRSGYFIDHVDTEWCLRALAAGYKLYGVYEALLTHSIGDNAKHIPFLKSRQITFHAPYRDYYMFRNTLLCIRNTHRFYSLKLFLLLRLVYFCLYFLTVAPQRWARARMISLGLVHGFNGVDGQLDVSTLHCRKIPKTAVDPA